ncbi:MAG: leucine-rich repeat domain-containing protein [Promethearchaeota archaeon]
MTLINDIKQYVEKVIALYENANDDKERAYYVKEFGDLRLRTERVFTFLEHCLMSDESYLVRSEAAKSLILTFGEKSRKPIRWAIQQERHAFFFRTLLNLAEKLNDVFANELKSQIFKRFSKIYKCHEDDAKFIWELDSHCLEFRNSWELDFNLTCISRAHRMKNNRISTLELRLPDLKSLKNVPESIGNLSELIELNLSRNKLKSLPTSMKHLKKLKVLNLSDNSLGRLPKWLGDLPELRQLYLGNTTLESIPRWLIKLSEKNYAPNYILEGVLASEAIVLGLLEILLRGARILKFEGDEINQCAHYAQYFKLNENGNVIAIYLWDEEPNLAIIPEQICELEYIEVLSLTGSPYITKFPHSITNLKSLRKLDLFYNNIRYIDQSIRLFLERLEKCEITKYTFFHEYMKDMGYEI